MTKSIFANGVFEPHELQALKTAFEEIVAMPWFDPDPGARERFASYIIETYPHGAIDMPTLRENLETSARMFYSVED